MDYNQYEWSAILPQGSAKKKFFIHLIVTLPIFPILLGLAYQFGGQLSDGTSTGILWLSGVLSIVLYISINLFWWIAIKQAKAKLFGYKLNEKGLLVNNKETLTLQQLTTPTFLSAVKTQILPFEAWDKTELKKPIELVCTSANNYKLFFQREYDRQQFIRAIQQHTNN